jgi:hypothetical protein
MKLKAPLHFAAPPISRAAVSGSGLEQPVGRSYFFGGFGHLGSHDEGAMSAFGYDCGYDRVGILDYLKNSVQRMRERAEHDAGQLGDTLRQAADDIAADIAKLEAELIAAGYITPKPANEA